MLARESRRNAFDRFGNSLEGFAAFDRRFGVLDRPLDVERAFELTR